jgi:hypothetical protein
MKGVKPTSRTLKPLDAVLQFQFCGPESVEIIEILDGRIQERRRVRPGDAVSEAERKYMFYDDEADLARDMIRMRKSCSFNVYKREP